ncbi:hypothetical protein A2833_01050 [Candidatus Azambacteria bacterium RIFCSPHIGHO2_01_FULL_44_55]|uniref:Uncharacterized protein n=1 Tax=Candidatus Azambacteria bacterium RIFCSPLOWO2_02_FULL_44_14 TaxID=1797306 RepID=A0A1F5CAH4_9BACT|nr:MAG: hypothetical protein A3A18_00865 [Candidatus Azambacteria bacterium RIFCSPLOWO2_01_FULL_44_84]OGD33653.1 MAG: hypothetical protein A3C78_03355 [Candidatus Azambacteria bacterium RIFCSPHIGHO2_02_FULL_45_18]OGD39844.1 MAG: hypothetical protein A3I30_00340 [Candidatus Azambacteria bacterium RIFCSPLOWO2_02_FULL_44_14]OGD41805.1 MAG: hypothetical protein A2833_01050 [Candidatus Azambacteria bacterium RIFCSPHIGHO2_01_FULL_44_55]OGD52027.1 MAG: hypothetical protein A2608_00005 [Candidatus Azam
MNQTQKILPRWFHVWFYISCLVLFAGGVANKLTGVPDEGLNLWGAAVGVFAMYLLTLLVWRHREALQALVAKISLPLAVKSVLIGWFFAEIDELVNYPFNPLFPGISLFQDIIFTTPFYLLVHLGWFWVLRKYKFTITETFVIGGLTLGLFEVFFGGVNVLAILGILVFPFIVMVHGVHMVMPKIALARELDNENQTDTKWKYVIGILVPAAGGIIGIGLMFLLSFLLVSTGLMSPIV